MTHCENNTCLRSSQWQHIDQSTKHASQQELPPAKTGLVRLAFAGAI